MDNIITEDYVSFETAKLLKEKGFDEDCVSAYQDGNLTLVSSLGLRYELGAGDLVTTFSNPECKYNPDMISAPTLQMAMKWLREVHKIGVFPTTYSIMRGNKIAYVYDAVIINLHTHTLMTEELEFEKDSYEEAAEAAIKYCLENLI